MKFTSKVLAVFFFVIAQTSVNAQESKWEEIDSIGFFEKEVITKDGLTLIFINKDSLSSDITLQRLKDAFWETYPKEIKEFNSGSLKTITVVISDEYKGVAATLNGVIKINNNWMKKNPEDIDVITHELMHVVQDYTYHTPDSWLTDGIADYARYKFGVNNEKSGWALTPYKDGQSYKNSYRIAARFLVWVETRKRADLVKKLDSALRDGTYKPSLWVDLTGKDVDALWSEYSRDPTI